MLENLSRQYLRQYLRRQAAATSDGRKKQTQLEKLGLVKVVEHWWQTQLDLLPNGRSPNIQILWQLLVEMQ